MAVLFCPHCGSQQVSEEDLYCRKCGNRYSNVSSESPLPSQPEVNPPVANGSTVELTEVVDSEKTAATKNTGEFKTNWLNFWIYFHLPATVLLGIASFFSVASVELLFGEIIVEIPLACLAIALITGLRRRKLSAWQLNFLWIFMDVLAFAAERLGDGSIEDKLTTFVGHLIMYGLIWGAPNFIYFEKRRVLFTGEPLVENGLKGVPRAIWRFIWPSVGQQELAQHASRQGLSIPTPAARKVPLSSQKVPARYTC